MDKLVARIVSAAAVADRGWLAMEWRRSHTIEAPLVEFLRKSRILGEPDSVLPIQKELATQLRDVKVFTVAWIFMLNGVGSIKSLPPEHGLWLKARADELLEHVTRDVARLCAVEFVQLCKTYRALCMAQQRALSGVRSLKRAIVCLRDSSSHLTPLHADFVLLCLVGKCHHYALGILKEPVWRLQCSGARQLVTVEDLLLYRYYGGMAYCGDRQFVEARRWLERCLMVPSMTPSAITLAAYKKWVLVSLLVDGKSGGLPRGVSPCVSVACPRLAEAYGALARACGKSNSGAAAAAAAAAAATGGGGGNSGSGAVDMDVADAEPMFSGPLAAVERQVFRYADELVADGNLGLVKQAVSAMKRLHIRKQTQTYVTMSLAQIAASAGLDSDAAAEAEIVAMIDAGEIYASINQRDGMVVFHDAPETFRSLAMLRTVNARIGEVMQLGRMIAQLDEDVRLSESHLRKVVASDGASGGGAVMGDIGAGGDADLMMAIEASSMAQ